MSVLSTSVDFVTFLRENREDILVEWERRVRGLPPAANLDTDALVDHLPVILDDIAEAADAALAGEEPPPLRSHPDRHAILRLHQGYDLGQVVTEYSLLRETIQELSVRRSSAYPEALHVFNKVLDGAIRQAVHRYSEASQRMLKALDRISMLALESSDEKKLLRPLLEIMVQAAPAVDEVTILLKEDGRLIVRDAVGITREREVNFSLAVGEGFSGTIAARHEPLFLRSAETDPLVRSRFLKEHGIKALYGVPLMDGTEVIGVAHMGSVTAYEFLDEDMFLFRAMANRASQLIIETRLKQQVRDKAAELELVLESAQLGSFNWDLRGGRLRWSDLTRRLFGIGPDETISPYSFFDLLAPEDRERVAAAISDTLEKGSDYRVRYRVALRNGGERHVSARGAVIREDGEPVRFLGTVQDRSDEEYAEQERGLFLAALGHDLRGPLAAIKLAADNLLRHAALAEPVQKTVARIARSSDRMARLIEQLLDFARARAGRPIALSRRRVDLVEVWHHVLDEVALSEPDRRIALTTTGDTQGEWDADRLAQVFQNLLGNALQYGESRRPISIRVNGENEQVTSEVHNWGPPIPRSLMTGLFDPFRRGRQGGRGLGLGLYIAQQIVAAHGGTIEVSSSEETGTSFRVVVPRR